MRKARTTHSENSFKREFNSKKKEPEGKNTREREKKDMYENIYKEKKVPKKVEWCKKERCRKKREERYTTQLTYDSLIKVAFEQKGFLTQ